MILRIRELIHSIPAFSHQVAVPERVPVALAGAVCVGDAVVNEGGHPDDVHDTPGQPQQQQTLLGAVRVSIVGGPGHRPEPVDADKRNGDRGSERERETAGCSE